MADCVVAEDSDFCQCVVENDGNTEIVSERIVAAVIPVIS